MFLIYAPAVLVVWLPLLLGGGELGLWHLLVAGMVSLHFGKRCLETLFVHRYSGVMNLVSALMICSLYTVVAWMVGEVAASEVGKDGTALPQPSLQMAIGLALWVVGVGGNFWHHRILANLRKPGETGYKLPKGGLFGLVATPHYLMEVVGWWGFVLVLGHASDAVIAWTMMLYLAGRSHNTLKWYRERLGDEVPAGWKRMIPFVY